MKKIILFFLVFLFFSFFVSKKSYASTWYYPMDKFTERVSVKPFGLLIDRNFYIGKEKLFPGKFFGYHSGDDLEIFQAEENTNVPIFAVNSGTITYVGNAAGYGGLILENLGGHTALYGHLKLKSITFEKGDQVEAGQQLGILGEAFSAETAGERKHLHFGIYKGSDLYFKGHEESFTQLQSKWEDPVKYLAEQGAVSPIAPTATQIPAIQSPTTPSFSFFDLIKELLKQVGFNF